MIDNMSNPEIRVSPYFIADVEKFRDILDSIETYTTYYIERLESKSYSKGEVFDIFKSIHRQISTLSLVHISMIKKASIYRPNNQALYNFLNCIGSYISEMTQIVTSAAEKYRRNPIYNIRRVYKALEDIKYLVEVIKKELANSIERGLFL